MKILVIDDERAFGSLLSRTLKRLGHDTVVALHPQDALALLDDSIDAVITDIDMPVMDGVELAKQLRARRAELPIAFCTGSEPTAPVVAEAAQIGCVLPKVWTVSDVKQVVESFRPRRRARGTNPPPIEDASAARASAAPDTPRVASPESRRRRNRRLRIGCRTWEQVEKLCTRQETGHNLVTVRGPMSTRMGDHVSIALALPDELVVSIGGVVKGVRSTEQANKASITVEMSGLTAELCERLRGMARGIGGAAGNHGVASPSVSAPANDVVEVEIPLTSPRGSQPRVSDMLVGNYRLREQIDALGRNLRRKDDDDSE